MDDDSSETKAIENESIPHFDTESGENDNDNLKATQNNTDDFDDNSSSSGSDYRPHFMRDSSSR